MTNRIPTSSTTQGIPIPHQMQVQTQTHHQQWLQAGFTDTIPVIPPDAVLHETSKVDPKARGKVPGDYYGGAFDGMGNWPSYVMDEAKAIRWDGLGANVGLKTGVRWTVLDLDVTCEHTAQAMVSRAHQLGNGGYFIRWGQTPKFAVLFAIAPGETIRRRQFPIKRYVETQRIEIMGVTAKGRPSQVVVAGTHPSGRPYQWNQPPQADQVIPATAAQMDYLVDEMLTIAEAHGWTKGRASNVNTSNDGLSGLGSEPYDPRLVAPVVACIANDDYEYDDWIAIGYAIKNACGGGGWELFNAMSRKAPKNDPEFTKRMWDGFEAGGYSGFGKLVHWARRSMGGQLPGDLEMRVRQGMALKGAMQAGMPETAPAIPGMPINGANVPLNGEVYEPGQEMTVMGAGGVEFTQDDKGNLVTNAANIEAYFMNSDLWRGVFTFDTFQQRPVFGRDCPILDAKVGDLVEDRHITQTMMWFQRYVFKKVTHTDVSNGFLAAVHRHRFDPLQDYLNGLQWDGTQRIGSWLWKYCGIKADDLTYLTYLAAVGRKWLIGAVARAMKPGEKMDNALIFEGPQGVGKSSALRALCPNPDWFGDGLPDFHDKDAKIYILGKWIIELAELTQLKKTELTQTRQFLAQQVDDFRLPFGRLNTRVPRRMAFAGSTNSDDYLRDPAGERRFWIVQTNGKFDIPGLTAVRDQLWAEALQAYRNGEEWHLTSAEDRAAREIQMDRVQIDPWQETLGNLLVNRPETSIPECFALMGIDDKSRTTAQRNRIKSALVGLGYVRDGQFQQRGPLRKKARYVLK